MTGLSRWLQRRWYDANPPSALVPLSGLFRGVAALRRWAYQKGWKHSQRLPVPVIVVGNLTVGGTGKTPLTIWLAEFLKASGYRPGIVSRGYRGRTQPKPLAVYADTDPAEAGDEPVLIARRTGCPVYVFPHRATAGCALLAVADCDILIADDGLQHYALARDIEIAVVDGARRFGNGLCLPAGPLREPVERLAKVDFIVCRGGVPQAGEYAMELLGDEALNLADRTRRPLAEFVAQPLHAVAGIGQPANFFAMLKACGLDCAEHAFPDHHRYRPEDLDFGDAAPVLMTEKDAVKCQGFADSRLWSVPVRARLPDVFGTALLQQLKVKLDGQKTA